MIGQRDKCVVLMSVVMHVGRARSFRGGGGNMGCAARETEASRRRLIGLRGRDFIPQDRVLGPASVSSRASILAGLGAFRPDEPKVLVGGDRPKEGPRRLNHASADIRAVLAEAAARDG